MNECEENYRCNFHPKVVIIGICALCLKERLLILAAKQKRYSLSKRRQENSKETLKFSRKKMFLTLPRIFALISFVNRLELRNNEQETSRRDPLGRHQDSFISIKFERDGQYSWENDGKSKPCKSMVQHSKLKWPSPRWRKRIYHLFQIIRLRKFIIKSNAFRRENKNLQRVNGRNSEMSDERHQQAEEV